MPPNIHSAMLDGPAGPQVPADTAWAQARAGQDVRASKEPWETLIGSIAQAQALTAALAVVPCALFISAVLSGTREPTARLLAGAIVAGLFVAFVALQTGWRLGVEQGMLDRTLFDGVQARRAAISAQEAAARKMAFKLPRQPNGEGYLYVIEFSTGTVKVGQTEDPKKRLGDHRADAAAFGVYIVNYWISPAHNNFKANETRLINSCVAVSRRSRKEYFHEVSYATARQFVNELTYFSSNTTQTSVEGVWA